MVFYGQAGLHCIINALIYKILYTVREKVIHFIVKIHTEYSMYLFTSSVSDKLKIKLYRTNNIAKKERRFSEKSAVEHVKTETVLPLKN